MDPAVSPRSVGVRYVDSLRIKDTLVKNDSLQSSERDPGLTPCRKETIFGASAPRAPEYPNAR